MHRILLFATLFAALLVVFDSAAAGSILTVGDDPSCDFDDLQDALDQAATAYPETVFIEINHDVEIVDPPLVVRGANVRIEGGYFGCGSGLRAGSTDLSARGENRAFVVARALVEPRNPSRLTLRHIQVLDGRAFSGAGIQISGGSEVYLQDSNVIGNSARLRGGGVEVLEGSILELFGTSIISANEAGRLDRSGQGGGVYCSGDPARIALTSGVELSGNQVFNAGPGLSRGGGFFIEDGCNISMFGDAAVNLNRADEGGGGYLDDAVATLHTVTDEEGVLATPRFEGNQVRKTGGALVLVNNSILSAKRAAFVGNGLTLDATPTGASTIHLQDGSEFKTSVIPGVPSDCPDGPACSQFTHNDADDLPMILLGHLSKARLRGMLIADNGGESASLIRIDDFRATVELGNSFVAQNAVDHLVDGMVADGSVDIIQNTVADNAGLASIISVDDNRDGFFLTVSNNLLMQDAPFLTGQGRFSNETWECHVGVAAQSEPFDRERLISDAGFVDAADLDYRLGPGSEAVDRCGDPQDSYGADIDGRPRPVDHAEVPGFLFVDAGAQEVQAPSAQRTLTVNIEGSGTVTDIEITRAGVDCRETCQVALDALEDVLLLATPDPGFGAVWEDCPLVVDQDACSIFMDQDRSVAVRFAPLHELTLGVFGPGRITSPALHSPINCNTESCSFQVLEGESIRFTALPDPGAIFVEWQGACAGAAQDCALTLDQPARAEAHFAEVPVFRDRFEEN